MLVLARAGHQKGAENVVHDALELEGRDACFRADHICLLPFVSQFLNLLLDPSKVFGTRIVDGLRIECRLGLDQYFVNLLAVV